MRTFNFVPGGILFFSLVSISAFSSHTYGMGRGHHRQLIQNSSSASGSTINHVTILAPEASGTKLREIVKWEDLSAQYVLGYGWDQEGKALVPFAIYDKTFSTPFYSHFWKLFLLGSIEIGDVNLAKLTTFTNEKKNKKNLEKTTDLFDILSSEAFSIRKSIQVDADFWRSKTLIWKKGKEPNLTTLHPLRISFNDLDWEAMNEARKSFATAVSTYDSSAALLGEHEEIPLNHLPQTAVDQFQDLVFLWNEGGFYEVFFPRSEAVQPVKVIDLKNKSSSFAKAATFAALSNIIKAGLIAIPFYGPPQFAVANLERAFDLVEILYLLRHSQALGLVVEALDQNPNSPFLTEKLSRQDLDDAVFYLLRANTLLSNVVYNLFVKNKNIAPNYIDKINRQRERGIHHLRKKGIEVFPIDHTYFGLGFQRDKKLGVLEKLRIYALSYSKFATHTPMAAVDFLHPKHERIKRNVLQGLLYASNFIYTPIPGISSIIKLLYKELVIREVHRRQMWESALLGHIHHSPDELKELLIQNVGLTEEKAEEYERLAISSIENGRMNPLDLDSEESIVHGKKVEEWIRLRDPTYVPWEGVDPLGPGFKIVHK